MYRIITLLSVLLIAGCRDAPEEKTAMVADLPQPTETIESESLTIPVYDFNGLKPLLDQDDETVYVINFWATWCAPCVKEMPYFEQLTTDYKPADLQVILVSLDMPRMWESQLVPFVKERKLKSLVVVLDDPKQNDWIPEVHKSWSGGIPATLIYKGKERRFYEHAFTYEKLKKEIENFKPNKS